MRIRVEEVDGLAGGGHTEARMDCERSFEVFVCPDQKEAVGRNARTRWELPFPRGVGIVGQVAAG